MPATEQFANYVATTLNGAINNSVTSITITSATGFPAAAQYRIKIDSEILIVTAGAGTTTWTVTRGAEGTTAASHSNGAAVAHVLTAGALQYWAPAYNTLPRHNNMLAQTFQPEMAMNTLTMTSGQVWVHKIYVPYSITVTNIVLAMSTNGATLTSGQSLAGIYNSSGSKLRETADLSTSWASASPAIKTNALTATLDITGGPDIWIYVALLCVGTTPPTWRRATTSSDLGNVGLAAADGYRFGTAATGQTTLPSSFTVSSVTINSNSYWIGLS